MKLSKSFKYSLLSLMALTTLGVTLNTSSTTAKAVSYQPAGDTTWSPHWSDGVKSSYSVSGQGSSLGSASWGADGMHAWAPKNGMTIKYEKLGVYPGTKKQIDMWIKVKSHSGSYGMGYKSKHGVSFNMFSGGSETATVEVSFHYHAGGVVKWNNDVIGLAYSDLEPARLGVWGKGQAGSFNQYIKSNTDPSSWHPWTGGKPTDSWIDQNKLKTNVFQVQNKLNLPSNLIGATKTSPGMGYNPISGKKVKEKKGDTNNDNLHSIWANEVSRDLNPDIHYGGAIAEYKADGAKTITMTIHGHGSGNNEYVFTGAKSYPKKTTKSTISKSITYNGKTSTANTLKDKDDTMVYNVNATVSAKKGAYITDALPHRFTVTKVSAVTNFSHNSVASINSSHQFKATLNNDKLDGKNKKITFHITGNMGTWMDKHPSMVDTLKWPVANTAYWYQKSTGKLKSNKVTTNYKNGGTKGKVTFNFIDFDNHGRELKTKKTITSLGTGKTYKPAKTITWKTNGKSYKYVVGKTDGTPATPATYTHAKFLKDQRVEALTWRV